MSSCAERDLRLASLAAAGWNTAALPPDDVPVDLSTDACVTAFSPGRQRAPDLASTVRRVLGFDHAFPTHLGRGAELVLASLVGAGEVVAANEVYVTGAWSIARRGGRTVRLPRGTASPADVDLQALRSILEKEAVSWVHLCSPRVRLGEAAGSIITLDNLRRVRGVVSAMPNPVPLVLDASRIWEHAVRLRPHDTPGSTRRDVLNICSQADIVVLSGRKGAGAHAGLIACRDAAMARRLRTATEILEGAAETGGCSADEVEKLSRGLLVAAAGARRRWHCVEEQARRAVKDGLPIAACGAGSIFIDAKDWLPGLPREHHPAQTLAALLYVECGIKVLARAVGETGRPIVRLAVSGTTAPIHNSLAAVYRLARDRRSGLIRRGRAGTEPFTEPLEPAVPADWVRKQATEAPAVARDIDDASDTSDSTSQLLRRLLDLPDDWIIVLAPRERGPQSLLLEAWLRSGGSVSCEDRLLSELAEFWRSPNQASTGPTLRKIRFGELDDYDKAAADESLAVDIGAWPLFAGSLGEASLANKEVRAWWSCASEGAFLTVRRDDPLLADIRKSALLFAGEPRDGGLSAAALQALRETAQHILKAPRASRADEEDR